MDREAIRDCLLRYARGVDRFDRELIVSAFHPGAIDVHGKFVGTMNRQGKPLNMNGGRYIDRLEKRDGVWAIVARKLVRDWADMDTQPDMSDLSSMTSTRGTLTPEMRAFMNGGQGARRDRSDPSYERPLGVDPQRRTAYLRLKNGMKGR